MSEADRMILIVLGYGLFLLGCTWLIVWGVGLWARHDAHAEQARRAAGLQSDRRKVR